MRNKIKIFDYCWHISHQWDMVNALKDNCEFYYCLNLKCHWNVSQRPLPNNIKFVTHYDANSYDVAILHIDQQIIEPDGQKLLIYQHFNEIIKDIPKIVINHGSPVYNEYFIRQGLDITENEMQQRCVDVVRQFIGDNTMVVNSYDSASNSEWGFGHPIIHGINPQEWIDLPKEPRVFTALSPRGFDNYYNRECMKEVADILFDDHGYILCYARLNVDTGNSPDDYKRYLGRSLLYLDTSFRTPMNRSRTEAFLSGCCVLQVEGAHDLDRWAKHNENIILVPNDPIKISNIIADLIENNYWKAIEIGKKGKEMAMREFSQERYKNDWMQLLNSVLN